MDSGVNTANFCPPILEIRLFSNAEDLEIDDLMQQHYDSRHSNPASVLESVIDSQQNSSEIRSVRLSSVRKYSH